ncbi:MAG: HAMP domain-containing sensor histidine kinase [Candidatus Woykebacteria bacterium]
MQETTSQKQNVQTEKLESVKDEFISIVSHELRTPMSTIKGYLNMLLAGDAGPVSPQVRDVLTEMLLAVEREIRLVNGMLDISRLEAGRMQFILRDDIDVVEQARLLLQSLIRSASEKKLSLILEAPSENLPKVQADTDKLVQVLINLVGNAMKFTKKGSITVNFSQKEDYVITCVADTGAGVPVEKQSHLFEKFSQASTKETRVSGGSGLGLYISKVIIEKLGGKIWLGESKPQEGSKFCFSLPTTGSKKAREVAENLTQEEGKN